MLLATGTGPTSVRGRGNRMVARAARHALWSLDVDSGDILQQIPSGDRPAVHCRIEDVGEELLLVSSDYRTLDCFARV